jgi:hypothetical protein
VGTIRLIILTPLAMLHGEQIQWLLLTDIVVFFLINIITEESYDEKQINNNVYFYLDIYVIWL